MPQILSPSWLPPAHHIYTNNSFLPRLSSSLSSERPPLTIPLNPNLLPVPTPWLSKADAEHFLFFFKAPAIHFLRTIWGPLGRKNNIPGCFNRENRIQKIGQKGTERWKSRKLEEEVGLAGSSLSRGLGTIRTRRGRLQGRPELGGACPWGAGRGSGEWLWGGAAWQVLMLLTGGGTGGGRLEGTRICKQQ